MKTETKIESPHNESHKTKVEQEDEEEEGEMKPSIERDETLESSMNEKTLVIEENPMNQQHNQSKHEEVDEEQEEEEEESEEEEGQVPADQVSKACDEDNEEEEEDDDDIEDPTMDEDQAVSENGLGERDDEDKPSEEPKPEPPKPNVSFPPLHRPNPGKIFSPLDFLTKSEEKSPDLSSNPAFTFLKSLETKDSPLNLSIEHMLRQTSSPKQTKPGTPDLAKLSSFNPPPASPKPPLNFLPSPAPPAHSPAPSFNPLLPPHLQPALLAAAFQQFFLPEIYQNFYPKPPNTPAGGHGSQSPHLNSSTCSSPAPNESDDSQPPTQCNVAVEREAVKAESNASLVRVLDRGSNSCSRTDIHFNYLPNAFYLR